MPTADELTLPAVATGRRGVASRLVMPFVLAGVLLVMYLWVGSRDLDSTEQRRINADNIITVLGEHALLTLVSTVLVLVIAVPLGVLLTRPSLARVTGPAVTVFNIGQALPTLGILVLFAITWNIGFWPVIVSLVAYTVLPVLRNTMVGLQQVDRAVIEAARGMGMSKASVLMRVELPLAVPIIMAGVRTALVINVGTATLAAFVDGGGLGTLIVAGTAAGRDLIIIVGAVLTAVLALALDYLAGIAEDVLRPKGL